MATSTFTQLLSSELVTADGKESLCVQASMQGSKVSYLFRFMMGGSQHTSHRNTFLLPTRHLATRLLQGNALQLYVNWAACAWKRERIKSTKSAA